VTASSQQFSNIGYQASLRNESEEKNVHVPSNALPEFLLHTAHKLEAQNGSIPVYRLDEYSSNKVKMCEIHSI